MSMDYKSPCKRNKLKCTAKPSTSIGKRNAYKYFQIRYNMEDINDRTVLTATTKMSIQIMLHINVQPDQLVSGQKYELPILKASVRACASMQLNG